MGRRHPNLWRPDESSAPADPPEGFHYCAAGACKNFVREEGAKCDACSTDKPRVAPSHLLF